MNQHSHHCFHCGEPVPGSLDLRVTIFGKPEMMCCLGCQAVAEQIIELGLTDYYRHRTGFPAKPEELVPEQIRELLVFDNEQLQSSFLIGHNQEDKEARFIIEGIVCPACSWLIESSINKLAGVIKVSVNYSSQRCHLNWDSKQIKLSDILQEIHQLGYKAIPFNPKNRELSYEKERRSQLIKLGIAGLFGMQVMMIAVVLYFGDAYGIEKHYRIFFSMAKCITHLTCFALFRDIHILWRIP